MANTTNKKKPASGAKKSTAQSKKTTQPNKKTTASSTRSGSKVQIIDEGRLKAKRQLAAIGIFAFSVFFLCLTLIPGENVWEWMRSVVLGLFGYCSFLFPLIMIYISVMYAMDKFDEGALYKTIEVVFFIVFLCSAFFVYGGNYSQNGVFEDVKAAYAAGIGEGANGGVVGALLGGALCKLFGTTGAGITIAIGIFVMFMLVTGLTLIRLFRAMWTPVKKIEEYSENKINEISNKKPKKFNIDVDLGPEESAPDIFADEEPLTVIKGGKKKKPAEKTEKEKIEEIFNVREKQEGPAKEEKPIAAEPPVAEASLDAIVSKAAEATKISAEPVPKATVSKEKEKEFAVEDENSSLEPGEYKFPPISCLREGKKNSSSVNSEELKQNANKLVSTLKSFGVETKIVDISRGPSVTRYELQPSAGVKISRITNLADDIALNLAASGVRIEAPIPNKPAVGIELPNKTREMVTAREIIDTNRFRLAKSKLNVALGKDIAGNVTCADLSKMPHLLIAGTTGSGKSVCVNAMIISLLYNARPDEVKLLMIDPKQVEFTVYNGIPHLLVPVVTDPRKASGALAWAVSEMLKRYKLFSEANVRDMNGYNKMCAASEDKKPLPHIVIFIDELSDLMMAAPNEVEDSICRLAQMARAAGMHLVIATQRPSVDVITGLIKANIPSRIALTVSSQIDSRTILDSAGAEKLLGNGDMLFNPIGAAKPIRIQGCFLADEEVENVVNYIKQQESASYDESVNEEIERQAAVEKKKSSGGSDGFDGEAEDDMLPKAIEVVVEAQMASTTLLQRKLRLGYARAARLVDALEERGIIGPFEGAKPRKVLMTKQQWMEKNALASDPSADETTE